jgi:hypothetical protein
MAAMARRLLSATALLLVFSACRPTQTSLKLEEYEKTYDPDAAEKKRASFDLQCPIAQTQLSSIDSMSFGARGCGRQLRYMKRCRRCQWEPAGVVTNVVER